MSRFYMTPQMWLSAVLVFENPLSNNRDRMVPMICNKNMTSLTRKMQK
jgi:hypothetical protein